MQTSSQAIEVLCCLAKICTLSTAAVDKKALRHDTYISAVQCQSMASLLSSPSVCRNPGIHMRTCTRNWATVATGPPSISGVNYDHAAWQPGGSHHCSSTEGGTVPGGTEHTYCWMCIACTGNADHTVIMMSTMIPDPDRRIAGRYNGPFLVVPRRTRFCTILVLICWRLSRLNPPAVYWFATEQIAADCTYSCSSLPQPASPIWVQALQHSYPDRDDALGGAGPPFDGHGPSGSFVSERTTAACGQTYIPRSIALRLGMHTTYWYCCPLPLGTFCCSQQGG